TEWWAPPGSWFSFSHLFVRQEVASLLQAVRMFSMRLGVRLQGCASKLAHCFSQGGRLCSSAPTEARYEASHDQQTTSSKDSKSTARRVGSVRRHTRGHIA